MRQNHGKDHSVEENQKRRKIKSLAQRCPWLQVVLPVRKHEDIDFWNIRFIDLLETLTHRDLTRAEST